MIRTVASNGLTKRAGWLALRWIWNDAELRHAGHQRIDIELQHALRCPLPDDEQHRAAELFGRENLARPETTKQRQERLGYRIQHSIGRRP